MSAFTEAGLQKRPALSNHTNLSPRTSYVTPTHIPLLMLTTPVKVSLRATYVHYSRTHFGINVAVVFDRYPVDAAKNTVCMNRNE